MLGRFDSDTKKVSTTTCGFAFPSLFLGFPIVNFIHVRCVRELCTHTCLLAIYREELCYCTYCCTVTPVLYQLADSGWCRNYVLQLLHVLLVRALFGSRTAGLLYWCASHVSWYCGRAE